MKTPLLATIFCCIQILGGDLVLAQTWTPIQVPSYSWASITVSANGSTLAALEFPDLDVVWVSTNAGATWTSNTIAGIPSGSRLESVSCSATGEKMAAVAINTPAIFTSTNYGATWVSNSVPADAWWRIASSADGSRLVALGGGLMDTNPIYVSADSGQTWTQANAPVTNWVSVAASANGSNWVAAVENQFSEGGAIYTSTNGGLDWILLTNAPDVQWINVALSTDGAKLVASDGWGAIYTSTDSGLTWISNTVPAGLSVSVAMSADGSTLATASYINNYGGPGFIYTSTNAGTTWLSNSLPNLNWGRIASTADGAALFVAGQQSGSSGPGGIFVFQTVPSPKLAITPAGGSAEISWLVPSTNFVLQENLGLGATNWVALTNVPVLNYNNLQETVALPASSPVGFYRLSTP